MNVRWLTARALAAGLMLLFALGAAAQDAQDKDKDKKKKEPPDPPRTGVYMGQLRLLFDAWDVNKDGYLDKQELAVAFRGKGALPYDHAETKKKLAEEKKAEKDDSKKDDSEKSEKDKATSDKDKPKDKPSKTPDYSKVPDYQFLVQLDTDKDDQISREEFMTWARDYAVQLRDQADMLKEIKKTQDQLARLAKNAKNRATVEAKLRKQQQDVNRMQQTLRRYEKVQGSLRR